MTTLNAYIRDAAQHSRLVPGEGRCTGRFDHMGSALDAILWPITRAAADLLASSDLSLVRACSSPTCQWLFLDTSKNHRRRWCDMKACGNRAKARKFYARKKESAGENCWLLILIHRRSHPACGSAFHSSFENLQLISP